MDIVLYPEGLVFASVDLMHFGSAFPIDPSVRGEELRRKVSQMRKRLSISGCITTFSAEKIL